MESLTAMKIDVAHEALKAVPAAGYGGAWLFKISLPEVLIVVTIVYYVALLVTLVRDKWYKPWKEKREQASK
jgi:hypothetical protein